jgi:hypothetical protein
LYLLLHAGRVQKHARRFGAMPQDLRELAKWLQHRALFGSALFVTPKVQRDSVFANPAVRAAPRLLFFNYISPGGSKIGAERSRVKPARSGRAARRSKRSERLDAAPALGTLSSGKNGIAASPMMPTPRTPPRRLCPVEWSATPRRRPRSAALNLPRDSYAHARSAARSCDR